MFNYLESSDSSLSPSHVQVQILSGLLCIYFGFEGALYFLKSAGVVSFNTQPSIASSKDVLSTLKAISSMTYEKVKSMREKYHGISEVIKKAL